MQKKTMRKASFICLILIALQLMVFPGIWCLCMPPSIENVQVKEVTFRVADTWSVTPVFKPWLGDVLFVYSSDGCEYQFETRDWQGKLDSQIETGGIITLRYRETLTGNKILEAYYEGECIYPLDSYESRRENMRTPLLMLIIILEVLLWAVVLFLLVGEIRSWSIDWNRKKVLARKKQKREADGETHKAPISRKKQKRRKQNGKKRTDFSV